MNGVIKLFRSRGFYLEKVVEIMASSSQARAPASSSQIHAPPVNRVSYEDKQAVRIEVLKMLFATDELNMRVQCLQYHRTRIKEKLEVIRATTTSMMAEGLCESTEEAQRVLRTYAHTIQDIIRRP